MPNFFKNMNFNFQHILALIIVVAGFSYLFYVSRSNYIHANNNNVVGIIASISSILTMVVMHYFRQEKKSNPDDGTNFTISWSKNAATDTGTVAWMILEPY